MKNRRRIEMSCIFKIPERKHCACEMCSFARWFEHSKTLTCVKDGVDLSTFRFYEIPLTNKKKAACHETHSGFLPKEINIVGIHTISVMTGMVARTAVRGLPYFWRNGSIILM